MINQKMNPSKDLLQKIQYNAALAMIDAIRGTSRVSL